MRLLLCPESTAIMASHRLKLLLLNSIIGSTAAAPTVATQQAMHMWMHGPFQVDWHHTLPCQRIAPLPSMPAHHADHSMMHSAMHLSYTTHASRYIQMHLPCLAQLQNTALQVSLPYVLRPMCCSLQCAALQQQPSAPGQDISLRSFPPAQP